jgi:hypothetical protein
MPYLHTPDDDLCWHGVGYPSGVPTQIPDDLAIALGLTEAPAEPAPALEPTDGPALAAAVERLEELRLIYEVDGWKGIKAIADPLGVKKHPDGWDSSLLLIIEQEFSPEIAAELAE